MSICAHAQERVTEKRVLILEDVDGAGGRSWGDVSRRWRTGRTARLAIHNVRTWRSQVQKRVLNAADG